MVVYVIQALWKLRQEDHELQASLLYRFLLAMGGGSELLVQRH